MAPCTETPIHRVSRGATGRRSFPGQPYPFGFRHRAAGVWPFPLPRAFGRVAHWLLQTLPGLIPVIDGFDELLGVSGYDDAFSSLAGFLEQLEGEGQLLTSARSVYYEEEFLSRAGSMSATGGQAWSHDAVRVLAWSREDMEDYLTRWVENEGLSPDASAALRERVQGVFDDRNAALASKPLFFTRMVDLLRNNPDFSAGDDPLRALVHEYLARERTDKLLDRQSRSLLTDRRDGMAPNDTGS